MRILTDEQKRTMNLLTSKLPKTLGKPPSFFRVERDQTGKYVPNQE